MIYLDNHATTALDPRVLEAMLPWLAERVGNASSRTHAWGLRGARAVEEARELVAGAISASPGDVVFTSGATESNNLALRGAALARAPARKHLVAATTEHRAVLDVVRQLAREGWELTELPVDGLGVVDLGELRRAVREDTAVVSVMAANNEIGVVHPLGAIAELCHERGVWLHSDAAQVLGRLPFSVEDTQVDLASLSAHKAYGPQGVGALYVRSRPRCARIVPTLFGGGQERGLRPGTMNVPAIVGFGSAADLAVAAIEHEPARLARMTWRLYDGLCSRLDDVRLNGPAENRLPGNLNVEIPGVEAWEILQALSEVAASASSACTSAGRAGSHVVAALGGSKSRSRCSLRFGVGRFNTEEEMDRAAEWIAAAAIALGAKPARRPDGGGP